MNSSTVLYGFFALLFLFSLVLDLCADGVIPHAFVFMAFCMCLAMTVASSSLSAPEAGLDQVQTTTKGFAATALAKRFFTMSVWQIGIAISFVLFAIGLIWSFVR